MGVRFSRVYLSLMPPGMHRHLSSPSLVTTSIGSVVLGEETSPHTALPAQHSSFPRYSPDSPLRRRFAHGPDPRPPRPAQAAHS